MVQRLRWLGADIHIGHAAGNVDDVNVLVKSSAVAEDNPEVVAARQKGIPVIPRAEMLAERPAPADRDRHCRDTRQDLHDFADRRHFRRRQP